MLKFTKQEINILFKSLALYVFKNIKNLSEEDLKILKDLKSKLNDATKLNESVQILDKIYYKGKRGYVTGQINDKFIISIQGSTYLVDPKDLKEYNKKPDPTVTPKMKFDEKTQKLLFEQYVKCGIYERNVPIRINNCYVKYNEWENANPQQQVQVILEGNGIYVPKNQIKILEDINSFAAPENYIEGVIIDPATGEATENILFNVNDYTNAIGEADGVRIIRKNQEGEQEIQEVPKNTIKTLAV